MTPPVIVIGAGPTGLSAAYHLGSDALLLEAEHRVGGWCRSVVDGGFTFDYAGHIMFSNDAYVHELYELLLSSLLAAPQSPISSVALERAEDRRLLAALNAAHRGEYPRDASLASLFARQAAATPDAVALGHRGRQLTYRQLD